MPRSSYRTRRWIVAFILLGLLALAPPLLSALGLGVHMGLVTRIVIYALAAVSLDLVLGYGALVSFGHAMFFALGGYVVAIIGFHTEAKSFLFGWSGSNSALVVWPLALLACAVLAALVGVLALRTSGVQFIMITLAFAQMVFFLLVSLQIYGGDDGLVLAKRNAVPLLDLSRPLPFYYLCLGVLALWVLFCDRVVHSRFGLVFQALRQSERRAVNLGVNPLRFRLIAFVLSAVGTGLAGILWANYAKFVTPDMAAWTKSGELMGIVIVGGLGTLLGPILGAAVYIGLEQVLAMWTEHWMLIMGPILVLIALFGQQGLLGRLIGERHDNTP